MSRTALVGEKHSNRLRINHHSGRKTRVATDNCPSDANTDQADADSDGVGDVCDECAAGDDNVDGDDDGVADACDICLTGDDDDDGIPDACDPNNTPKVSIRIEGVGGHDFETLELDSAERTQSSALNNVGVGTHVYLYAEASDHDATDTLTYQWSVSAPTGSAAGFLDVEDFLPGAPTDSTAIFMPDLEGAYEVSLTVDDGGVDKANAVATQTINAGTWVGSGIVHVDTSPPTISDSSCTGCHSGNFAADNFTPWLETGHAVMVSTGIDPEGSHYGEHCLACHTVGYDALASNGGFDDLEATSPWVFPEHPGPGSYQGLIDADPELAKLANIQCESCHGPASQHVANGGNPDLMGTSLDSGVCGQCHGEPPRHPRVIEWELSGHSHEDAEAFSHWEEDGDIVSGSCARCHAGSGFINFAKGEEDVSVPKKVHSCAVCHDPHSNENPYQLRVYGTTEVPVEIDGSDSTMDISGLGTSATCITCHNGRRTPASMIGRGATSSPRTPHYFVGGVMLLGMNAVEYGANITSSYHGTALGKMVGIQVPGIEYAEDDVDQENPIAVMNTEEIEFGCATCHMAVSTPDGNDPYTAHEFEHQVGQHTLQMKTEGYENAEMACGICHAGLDELNREAWADFDGNGTVEGVQDEVASLLATVKEAVIALGAVDLEGSYPYWNLSALAGDDVTLEKVKNALWNYEFVENDGSLGVHNTNYAVGVLQLTIKDLTGADIPDASLRYK